jgi:tyrosyl-DNA phosphodiesterase 2
LSKLPAENFSRCPFPNSPARRCYLKARVNPGDGLKPIRVATAHLESPDPPMAMHCEERAAQAKLTVSALSWEENVVFGGDTSWDDKVDLPFPLLDGWVDAWMELKNSGFSYMYDALWNRDPRRTGSRSRKSLNETAITQRRLDRFVCKLKDYELKDVELIGTENRMNTRIYKVVRLDMLNDRDEGISFLPSSHFGEVLTIVPKVEEATE